MRIKQLLHIGFFIFVFSISYGQTYEIKKYVFGSSAQTASNSSYTFENTVGQPAIGSYSSTDNTANVGFWYNILNPSESTLTIEFETGWNLVSSNIRPVYMDMETFMSDIEPNTVIVKDGNADIYLPAADLNTIGDWEIPDGYNVYVSSACSLDVTGTPVTPENEAISLNVGWNQIGYTRNSLMNPATAYASIVSDVVIVKDGNGKIYIPKYNLNTIGDLAPGKGYMLFYRSSGDFTYPANSMSKETSSNYFDNITKYFKSEYSNTGKSSVYLFHTDLPDYAEFAVYNNENKILGTGVVKNNIVAVTVWGDNEMTETTDGATEDLSLNCKYYYKGVEEDIEITNITSLTDDNNDFTYTTNSFKTADAFIDYNDKPVLYVSPNPVRDFGVINFNPGFEGNVEIKLVNSLGKTIKVLTDKHFNPTTNIINLRTQGIAQGTYFIVMTTNESIISKPLLILK